MDWRRNTTTRLNHLVCFCLVHRKERNLSSGLQISPHLLPFHLNLINGLNQHPGSQDAPGRVHSLISLGDMGMFLCRGVKAPASSSIQGGARDDSLGPGDSLLPWIEEAVLL